MRAGSPLPFLPSLIMRPLPQSLEAPERPRRLRFHRYQWVGLPLLVLVPVLALFGFFGRTDARADGIGAGLVLSVHYAGRQRVTQPNTVEVLVENTSGRRLDTVVVAFAPEYVRAFSSPTFMPEPTQPFEVEIPSLGSGEVGRVRAEMKGEAIGRHRGAVWAFERGGTDTTSVT